MLSWLTREQKPHHHGSSSGNEPCSGSPQKKTGHIIYLPTYPWGTAKDKRTFPGQQTYATDFLCKSLHEITQVTVPITQPWSLAATNLVCTMPPPPPSEGWRNAGVMVTLLRLWSKSSQRQIHIIMSLGRPFVPVCFVLRPSRDITTLSPCKRIHLPNYVDTAFCRTCSIGCNPQVHPSMYYVCMYVTLLYVLYSLHVWNSQLLTPIFPVVVVWQKKEKKKKHIQYVNIW